MILFLPTRKKKEVIIFDCIAHQVTPLLGKFEIIYIIYHKYYDEAIPWISRKYLNSFNLLNYAC